MTFVKIPERDATAFCLFYGCLTVSTLFALGGERVKPPIIFGGWEVILAVDLSMNSITNHMRSFYA